MGLLNHLELMIIQGVGKTPGDTVSSESDPIVVNLMDTDTGYSLVDWTPNIPSMKSGGTWADSPISDGRTLIAGANTNVIETIVIQLTGATMADYTFQFIKLQRIIQKARAYWNTQGQIEPVYLRWKANCAPGPQFALIYNIDLDLEFEDSPNAQAKITMKLEREYGWRGIKPGGNPKEWTYHYNNQDSQWNGTNANLLSGTDHLVSDTALDNRAEQSTGSAGYLIKNFVDIPSAKIPGDLPALLSLSVSPTSASAAPTTIMVGKSTKRTTGNLSRFTGVNQLQIYTFNASDGTGLIDTTLANDTGASKPIGGGTSQRSVTTFVTATMATRLQFYPGGSTPNGFSVSSLRGRFAVFARARVSAAATVDMQLAIQQGNGTDQLILERVTFSDLGVGGTGNTSDWGLVYLGQITLPFNKQIDVSSDGRGILFDAAGGSGLFIIKIQADRTAGAGSLYINDVIFMPIDEGAIKIAANIVVNTARVWNYDNTGYYTHGKVDDFADILSVSGTSNFESDIPQWGGGGITLTPGVDNRLTFMAFVDSTKRSFITDPTHMTARINIVPRWSGIRSE